MNPLNSTFSPFTNRKRPGKFNSLTSTPLISPRSSSNLLFTPSRTPLRQPLSYSLSEAPNSAQKITNTPQSRQMRYANLTAYTDGKSPGLHSRIVQYDNETRASLPATHQTRYGSPGLFPVVHFFKKETPVITPKARKVTVRLASPDLHWYNKSPLLKRTISESSPDTRNGHYHPKLTAETETRSVLDALREISRKRIHTSSDFDNTPESSCKRQRRGDGETYEGNKRAREESPKSDSSTVSPTQPQSKKICVVDLLAASYTSSQLLKDKMEKAIKRKQEVDIETDLGSKEDEQQIRKQLKLTNTATQTSETDKTIPEIKTSETPKVLRLETQPEVIQPEVTPDPEVKQSNIFDTKKLEIHRKNKLAVLLGAITGEKPSLLPVEKATEEENQTSEKADNKLVGILSPMNKPKHDKHVHFNLTPEVKSIESLESGNLNEAKATEPSTPPKSLPIVNFETPKAAPSVPKPKITIVQQTATESSIVIPRVTTSSVTSPMSKPETAPLSNLTFSFGASATKSDTLTTSSTTGGGFMFNLSPGKTTPSIQNSVSSSSNPQMTSPIFSVANSSNSTKTTVTSGSNFGAISFGGDTTKNFGGFGGLSSASTALTPVAIPQSCNMSSGGFGGISTASTATVSSTGFPVIPKASTASPNFGPVQFSSGSTPASSAPATTSSFGSGNFNLTATTTTFGTTSTGPPTFAFGSNTSTAGFGATATTTSSGFSFGAGGFGGKTGFGATTTTTTASGFNSSFTGFGATTNAPAFGTPSSIPSGFGTTTNTPAFGTSATTAAGFGTTTNTPAFGTPATGFGATTNAPAFGTPITTATGFGATTNTLAFGTPVTTATGFGAATNTTAFGAPATTTAGFGAAGNTPAFGTPATTAAGFVGAGKAPSFGVPATTAGGFGTSAFGAPTTNTAGFGAATNTPAFGTPTTGGSGFAAATTTATGFGNGNGFGATTGPKFGGNFAATTTTASGFGTSGFGQTTTAASSFGTTTTTASGFGFGTPTTTASTFGGFGGSTNAFGAKPTTQTTTGFGNTGTSGFGTPNFNGGQPAQPNIFGSTQNNTFTATTTTAPPAFGTNTTASKPFNFGAGNTPAPNNNFNSSGGFGFGAPASTTSSSSGFNAAKPSFGPSTGFGGSFGGNNNQPSAFGNTTNTFGGANATFGGNNANSNFAAPAFSGGFGNGDATTNFAKPQSTGTSFVAGSGDTATFQFGQGSNNTSAFGATNPTGNTPAGGPVFAFGGGAQPATTTAPTASIFAFGNAEAKPNVNFGAQASGFGTATPNFGAPAPGTFSIGSGSSAVPRQRHQLKAKRRT